MSDIPTTTVVAYYTAESPYEQEVARFSRSCHALGITPHLRAYPDRGDWNLNTAIKVGFLRSVRNSFNGPLLYVDVDAWLHSDPRPYMDHLALVGHDQAKSVNHHPAIALDFACHWFQGTRLLSGTMWLGDTDNCRKMLKRWQALNHSLAGEGTIYGQGQRNLCTVVLTMIKDGSLRTHALPGSFCYIFDKPWAYPAGTVPIIEHLQASRENRDASKGKRNEPRRKRIRELTGDSA